MTRPAKKIVLLGMMTKIPVAGVVWQTLHYLEGFRRLGHDVYYVEAHARAPSMFIEREDQDGSIEAAAFIDKTLRRFGFGDRWAFHALHSDGRCYGMTELQLKDLYRTADVLINLHGGTVPQDEHSSTGRLVYVETDPVELQIELHEGRQETIDFLTPHRAFFTFGENYGQPDCGLPVTDRFRFRTTRQPVVLPFWRPHDNVAADTFTTIGNWRQPWRNVTLDGEDYSWSKHIEFMKFLDLPERTGQAFELALSGHEDEDRTLLEAHGWQVREALPFTMRLNAYRNYIIRSRAEFTVAKDQNVRLRSGWFSDRSASYLAAGRPVVTQDTGFGNILPTGEGLFAFNTLDDIANAVDSINSDYERHSKAALAIAHEYFGAHRVLKRLLDQAGV